MGADVDGVGVADGEDGGKDVAGGEIQARTPAQDGKVRISGGVLSISWLAVRLSA